MSIKGLRVIPLVVLVITAASAAGGSYYFAQKHFNGDRSRLEKQIDSLIAEVASLTPKTSPTPQNYFVALPSFGVKFPYSNKTYNLLYTPSNGVIYFGLEGSGDTTPVPLQNNGSCVENTDANGLLGFLTRSTSPLLATPSSSVYLNHLGNYYYYYNYPKACSYSDSDKQAVDKAIKTLVEDLKQLELAS